MIAKKVKVDLRPNERDQWKPSGNLLENKKVELVKIKVPCSKLCYIQMRHINGRRASYLGTMYTFGFLRTNANHGLKQKYAKWGCYRKSELIS